MPAESALVDVAAARQADRVVASESDFPGRWDAHLRLPTGGYSKRAFDIVGSLTLIMFFLPLFALIAVMVKLNSSGPVLFGHRRLGHGGV